MAKENRGERFVVDHVGAVSKFSSAMQKLPVKKILYRNLFRGRGLEFDSYRDYSPGDDASRIDWMASVRAQKNVVRKYIEERNLHVYFVFDVSNSMLFGTGKKLKAEYAAEMIIALSYLIIHSGDRVGFFMISDKIKKFIPAKRGRRHFFKLVDELSNVSNYGGDFNMDDSIDVILDRVKSQYTVFIFVSDFIKVHSMIERSLGVLSSRFESLALMVRDPFDERLPSTSYQFSVCDPFSNRQLILDPVIAASRYQMIVKRHKERMKQIFLRNGIDLLELNTSQEFYLKVASFLLGRAKGTRE